MPDAHLQILWCLIVSAVELGQGLKPGSRRDGRWGRAKPSVTAPRDCLKRDLQL